MPTYSFQCKQEGCDHTWDEFLSIKSEDPEECPKCKKGGSITRLINSGNFILMGSGWAKDSYSK